VRYSLIRSGPDGDAIRVDVSSGIAGYLALYEVDAAGNAKQVYPVGDAATLVLADSSIQIPSTPIKIAAAGERLRLVLVPAPPGTFSVSAGSVGGVVNGAVNKAFSPIETPATPLVVDIPLGPN
jgi:hypothetical protein